MTGITIRVSFSDNLPNSGNHLVADTAMFPLQEAMPYTDSEASRAIVSDQFPLQYIFVSSKIKADRTITQFMP